MVIPNTWENHGFGRTADSSPFDAVSKKSTVGKLLYEYACAFVLIPDGHYTRTANRVIAETFGALVH